MKTSEVIVLRERGERENLSLRGDFWGWRYLTFSLDLWMGSLYTLLPTEYYIIVYLESQGLCDKPPHSHSCQTML